MGLWSASSLLAFVTFALVASVTPGPNNTLVMASGANFGLKRTLPHILGIGGGFALMLIGIGLGLNVVFEAFPSLLDALRYVGGSYLVYLALRLALAPAKPSASVPQGSAANGSADQPRIQGQPLNFIGAALFQWVNPKAWMMALTAVATYVPSPSAAALAANPNDWSSSYAFNLIVMALLFGIISLPCTTSWTLFGRAIGRLLQRPLHLRLFNISMGLLLLSSLWPVIQPYL